MRRATPRELLHRADRSTLDELRARGFSDQMIDSFWRPLFGGIQLDPDLEVSSRRFALILAMLAEGDAAVPAQGMGEIPAQLAADLPDGTVVLDTRVAEVGTDGVTTADGRRVGSRGLSSSPSKVLLRPGSSVYPIRARARCRTSSSARTPHRSRIGWSSSTVSGRARPRTSR